MCPPETKLARTVGEGGQRQHPVERPDQRRCGLQRDHVARAQRSVRAGRARRCVHSRHRPAASRNARPSTENVTAASTKQRSTNGPTVEATLDVEDPGGDHHRRHLHEGEDRRPDDLGEREDGARTTGAIALRRAAATSTPSEAHERGEPEHHGDDGGEQPAVPVGGVLERVGEHPRACSRRRPGCPAGRWEYVGLSSAPFSSPLLSWCAPLSFEEARPRADPLAPLGQRGRRLTRSLRGATRRVGPVASSTLSCPWVTPRSAPERSWVVLSAQRAARPAQLTGPRRLTSARRRRPAGRRRSAPPRGRPWTTVPCQRDQSDRWPRPVSRPCGCASRLSEAQNGTDPAGGEALVGRAR